jgi:V8-like Glu-specific endopeptidase
MENFEFLLIAALLIFPHTSRSESNFGVKGNDDRVDVNFSDPWARGIGKLDNGCTGTAIGGPYILSAAHCRAATSFCLHQSYGRCSDGNSYTVREVAAGKLGNTNTLPGNDWIILEATRNIPETSPININPNVRAGMKVTVVGYPNNRNSGQHPVVQTNCTVRYSSTDSITTDCDGTPGNSGGPMLYCPNGRNGNCEIVGVWIRSGDVDGIASSVSNFRNQLPRLASVRSTNSSFVSPAETYAHAKTYEVPHIPQPHSESYYPKQRRLADMSDYRREQARAEDLLRRTERLIRP